jgi:hypothetical protein
VANPNPNTTGLRPWRPGESGNPRGRSRRQRLDDILRDLLAQEIVDDNGNPVGETAGERFVARVVNHAVSTGNPALIREIFDRHDGKVPEPPKPADAPEKAGVASFRDLIDSPLNDDDDSNPPPDDSTGSEAVGGDPPPG